MTKKPLTILLNTILSSIMVIAVLCSIPVVSANASETETTAPMENIISETTEYHSDGSSTVSYTHLDVYKRQPLH